MATLLTRDRGIIGESGNIAGQLSTNSYVDVVDGVLYVAPYKMKNLLLSAANNALLVNVLGSIDEGAAYDFTLESNVAIAANNSTFKSYNNTCTHIKLQVKANAANAQGTLTTKYFHTSYPG
jgi:hypothetical protein